MNEKDYLEILKALAQMPFNVGKNLLADVLIGDINNPSIERNKLDDLKCFGELAYTKEEIHTTIDSLIRHGFIEQIAFNTINKYAKVLKITKKGTDEIRKPEFFKRKITFNNNQETNITVEEKKLFENFEFFLQGLNQEQKKAVITPAKNTVCIAGAGSGKTRVLTKRVEFLIKYRAVKPSKILAITFTRKARQEMQQRLNSAGIADAKIETFNSFCEKILRLNSQKIYGKDVRVMTYKDKIIGIRRALQNQNHDLRSAINIYFSYAQMRGKTDDQLAAIFMNDCFLALDTFKAQGGIVDFTKDAKPSFMQGAKLVHQTCIELDEYMQERGLRDFADQLLDTLKYFKENPQLKPQFDHILIDEYQDVNAAQIELINLLEPKNIFCVGDPRQSIFGWRGSDIKFIMDFEQNYAGAEVIFLTKNYRSKKLIVDFMNRAIKKLNMPDLECENQDEGLIKLLNFKTEKEEHLFILQAILGSEIEREEIYILARMNKTLNDFSKILKQNNIPHVVKSDEQIKKTDAKKGELTLATVHAIKGLEAKLVFILGCNSMNFPCKTSEHPVTELLKLQDYDKEEEERRLFYVAVSRAKEKLVMTYTGKNPTYFITADMRLLAEKGYTKKREATKYLFHNANKKNFINQEKQEDETPSKLDNKSKLLLLEELKAWRAKTAKQKNLPAFTIMRDATLLSIIEYVPETKHELEQIKGIGTEKLKKYGEDIIKLVEKYIR
ncbi:MAG: UvrD-helicase domain-containing protein [Candidatus Woesearchaeota archaeon]